MMDERTKALVERIEKTLVLDGFIKKNIYHHMENGLGDFKSFFDVLVEKKLCGEEIPTNEEVWEEMKMQINFLRSTLSKAADDYRKLENKHRYLTKDYEELLKEKHNG